MFRQVHPSLPILIAVNKRNKSVNLSDDDVLDFLEVEVEERQNISIIDVDLDIEANVIEWAASLFPKNTSFNNEPPINISDLPAYCPTRGEDHCYMDYDLVLLE